MPWQRRPALTKADIAAARRDTKKARFLVDESVDVAVAGSLRREGFNVVHASDVGLGGHSDDDIFAYAWREDRIILTHDADFLNDRAFPPQRNPGLVVLPAKVTSRGSLPLILTWIGRTVGHSRELWRRTKITFADEDSLVVHTFEQGEGRIVTTRYRRHAGHLEAWVD